MSRALRAAPLRRAVALILTAAALALPATVRADSLEDQIRQAREQQAQLEAERRAARARLNELDRKVQDATLAYRRALDELRATQAEVARLSRELEAAEADLAAAEAELERVTAELAKKQEALGKRVRVAYVDGQVEYLEVLFGATSFSDFLSRFEFLQLMAEQDSRLVADVRQMQAEAAARRQAMETRRNRVAALRDQAARRREEARIQEVKANQYKADLEAARARVRAELDEIDRQNALIAKQIAEWSRQLARARGQIVFQWPVSPVRVTSPFGERWHPIAQQRRMHWGIDLAASYGQPVRAAESGRVVSAGWRGGYGNTVIILHGTVGGVTYATLYGHNSRLAVSAGDEVKAGQVIAYAGSSGYSTGPHVHLEIWANGKAVDPLPYLPR